MITTCHLSTYVRGVIRDMRCVVCICNPTYLYERCVISDHYVFLSGVYVYYNVSLCDVYVYYNVSLCHVYVYYNVSILEVCDHNVSIRDKSAIITGN